MGTVIKIGVGVVIGGVAAYALGWWYFAKNWPG